MPPRALATVALATVAVAACATDRDDCARHSAAGRWGLAARPCAAAYRDHGDDGDGQRLAQVYLNTGRVDEAVAVARGLHDGYYAHYVQALALQDVRPVEALLHASLLLGDATVTWQPAWLGPAAYLQAGAAKALGNYALAEQALALIPALGGDPLSAQLGRVNLLRAAGDFEEARHLAQAAAAQAAAAPDPARATAYHAEAMLQLGLVHVEAGGFGPAGVALRRAARETERADQIVTAAMNLAFVAGELGRCGEAIAYLRLAGLTEDDNFHWRLLAGRVGLRCGAPADAARWLHAAAALPHEGQWTWQVHDLLGALAEREHDLAGAERQYLTAMAATEQMRRDGGRLEALVAGALIEPYQHAIELAARRADWRAALGLVLRHEQGGDPGPTLDATIAAWRGRTLAILVRGRDQVWRIDLVDGQLGGAAIGAVPRLGAIDVLAPTDPEALAITRTLGMAVMARPGAGVIHVNLIGDLATIPLAALRTATDRVIAHTALVRAVRITPRSRPRSTGTAAIVLGDPGADLPGARAEAVWVAGALGVTPVLGPAADRAALARARGAGVLHVASHATWSLDGPSLPLADGPVTAAELAALTPAPRLVVLASCFSARARDRGGWTSLAAGFLDAGADLVISTQTSVDDGAARRMVEAYYRHGGIATPAEALRQAQLELDAAGVDPHEWASFVAIGAPPTEP